MRILYHLWLHPFSRKVRLALAEKQIEYAPQVEKTWQRRPEFLSMNPAGDVPVLVEPDGTIIPNSNVICEYLEEIYPQTNLIGSSAIERIEIRRLIGWFDVKFNHEVTQNIVGEKLMKRFLKLGEPNGPAIRAGMANIHYHLDYITWLMQERRWLAGEHLSLADLAALSHLSAIDYIGDVPWEEHPKALDWYMRMCERPSFQSILDDTIPGIAPAGRIASMMQAHNLPQAADAMKA